MVPATVEQVQSGLELAGRRLPDDFVLTQGILDTLGQKGELLVVGVNNPTHVKNALG
jgi:hypothetical protein